MCFPSPWYPGIPEATSGQNCTSRDASTVRHRACYRIPIGPSHFFAKGSVQLQGRFMNYNPPHHCPTFNLFLPTPRPQDSGTDTEQARALLWVSGLQMGTSHSQQTRISLFPTPLKPWKHELQTLTLPNSTFVQWPWTVQAASLWLS